jgi:hypothetical protein
LAAGFSLAFEQSIQPGPQFRRVVGSFELRQQIPS